MQLHKHTQMSNVELPSVRGSNGNLCIQGALAMTEALGWMQLHCEEGL